MMSEGIDIFYWMDLLYKEHTVKNDLAHRNIRISM